MNDTESNKLIGDVEIEHIRRILNHKLETDEDYADLANLVEEEPCVEKNSSDLAA